MALGLSDPRGLRPDGLPTVAAELPDVRVPEQPGIDFHTGVGDDNSCLIANDRGGAIAHAPGPGDAGSKVLYVKSPDVISSTYVLPWIRAPPPGVTSS